MRKRQKKRNIYGRRIIAASLALLLAGNGLGAAPQTKASDTITLRNPWVSEVQGGELDTASGLRNPRVKMRMRDTITFGNYWQEDTNGDGVADQNDEKQPIRWQVLSVEGDDVFLLADRVLDCQRYNTKDESVTWETCSLRRWLNEEFYEAAFSGEEQAAITETTVINGDNPEYGTEGGEDTKDKLYLLSLSEVSDPAYGFHGMLEYADQARIGKATSYAEAKNVRENEEKGSYWLLRSPGIGHYEHIAACVHDIGDAYLVGYGTGGVRPALHLNLSSFSPENPPEKAEAEETAMAETAMEESEWDMVELGTWQGKPMPWRVLSVKNGDVFLLADRIITRQAYHKTYESVRWEVTWEKSTLRGWLNGDFYKNTFSEDEKKGIRDVSWENMDNPWFGTEGGADTTDPVSLLSLADIVRKEYGFPTAGYCNSEMRTAVDGRKKGWYWWLRSPGLDNHFPAFVCSGGYTQLDGLNVGPDNFGVRPALHFNLSSSSLKKVGTVTAKVDSMAGGASGGVTYDPSSLFGEFDPEPGQLSTSPDPSTPSGGSATQDKDSTGSQNGVLTGQKTDTKPGKVSSLKAKNNKKKAVTLSWKKVSKAKKYQIQYSQNNKFKKAKTKTTKKVSYKITKLAKKKTYYFRVRAVSADGKKGTWSKTVKVKIKK